MAVQQEIKLQLDRDFDGEIFLLAHVRYLGFCFNPVSFYFCYDRDRLKYIVAEVNNTPWNERHSYVLECADTSTQTFRFDKNFHVSPFNPMQMNYRWRFSISEQNIRINMKSYQDSHCDFRANLSLKKQPANSKNLSLILLRFPAVTLKTVSAIYWQALKLSLKGARFYSHPTSQQEPDHGKLR